MQMEVALIPASIRLMDRSDVSQASSLKPGGNPPHYPPTKARGSLAWKLNDLGDVDIGVCAIMPLGGFEHPPEVPKFVSIICNVAVPAEFAVLQALVCGYVETGSLCFTGAPRAAFL